MRYELVILIDARQKKDDISSLIANIEKFLWKWNKQKDDIGFLDLVWHQDFDRAYFVSYEAELEWEKVESIKKELSLIKWIHRAFFYKMWKNEKFLKFSDVNKKFELSKEEKEKQKQEKAFQDMDSMRKQKKK